MEKFLIGIVLKPQGIKGELKARINIDGEEIENIGYVYIDNLDKKFQIEKIRYSDGFMFLKLEGIDDRNQVELLRGSSLFVDRKEINIKENEFIIDEVIGFTLMTEENEELGQLESVDLYGSAPVFTINGKYGKSVFPCVDDVVIKFDYENKIIVINKKRFLEVRV